MTIHTPIAARAGLLILLGASLCISIASAAPMIVAPYTVGAPNVDGVLREGEWAVASGPSAFIDIATKQVAAVQPAVWILRDEDALYIAARLPLPKGKKPVANIATRDGQVWEDDAFEVFLDPGRGRGEYYQFIVNSAGAQWDSRQRNPAWNADWKTAALAGKDFWEVEMRLPFASLGVLSPGQDDVWALNLAWDRKTDTSMTASWAPVGATLHDPSTFGTLSFVEGIPFVQVSGPENALTGNIEFNGTWTAPSPTEANLTITRKEDGEARQIAAASAVHPGANATAALKLSAVIPKKGLFLEQGEYAINLTVTAQGKVAYSASAPLLVPAPLQLTVGKYFLEGQLEIGADLSGLGNLARRTGVTARLFNAQGKRVKIAALRKDASGLKVAGSLDVADLEPGEYKLAVAAVAGRRVLHQEETTITKPDTPEWMDSTAGLSDEVLAPWTPVEVDGGSVSVWGRKYDVGPLPLPRKVTVGDVPILAGPITLRMVADGQEHAWEQVGDLKTEEQGPAKVVLSATARGEGIRCSGKLAVEYDGMMRSDFTIFPGAAKTIEQLSLIIPIKEEHAKYLYHFPGHWGSAYNAGALPQAGFESAFRPYVWLGDDDRGLSWFSESDRNFFVADATKTIQISREAGIVTLQVNMIQGSFKPSGPIDYTFGFQATPVKPMRPDAWDYRICHQGSYGAPERPWYGAATITYPIEGNFNNDQGTFEAWVRPVFNPQPDVTRETPGRADLNRNLFAVNFGNGDVVGFYWNIDDRGMRVYYKQNDTHPLVFGTKADWKANEWHHVAFTWGDKTRIFLDGKMVAEHKYKGTVPRFDSGEIVIGATPSDFDIDEFRISDIPRESFDLTVPRAEDEHTLLLDRMDGIDPHADKRTTSAEKGKSGTAVGGKVIPGKWGYAFSLYESGEPKTVLDRLAELGVRTLVFHEQWTDIQNYTSTTHGEKLHELVKACHERGMKLLLYFGYEISNIAPEWDLYSDECLVYPRAGGYQRAPEQQAYIVCYNSKWQDFMAHGMAKMMDEYDIDGVYLDGTANPWGCSNVHHGCGYEKPDGSVGTTYRFFETRDMMRRIYTLVKTRKPDGQVNVHQSTCMTIPTLAWATSYWDGEQFGGIDKGPNPLEVLPLDAFRCEFMGRQWGVPAEFLCYERPYSYRQAMSFTLLHDVLVRGALGGNLELESKLWEGMESFGRPGAVFLPYWDNAPFVDVGPDDTIKVSIHSRAEDGCVAIVSNLGSEKKQADVHLDLEGLVIASGPTASDMVTGEDVQISEDGQMSFPLEPFDFRVVWVKPK